MNKSLGHLSSFFVLCFNAVDVVSGSCVLKEEQNENAIEQMPCRLLLPRTSADFDFGFFLVPEEQEAGERARRQSYWFSHER